MMSIRPNRFAPVFLIAAAVIAWFVFDDEPSTSAATASPTSFGAPNTPSNSMPVMPTPTAMPVATPVTDQSAKIVEEHARGIFFDRRPIQAQVMQFAQASRPSSAGLQRTQIMDNAGFGQPMPAMTLDAPQDWRVEGGVEWERGVECPWNGPRMQWSTTSPDGLYGIAVFPEMGWQVASGPIDRFDPCPSAPMSSVREYLEFIMRSARPNARVISYRERPEIDGPYNENQRKQSVSPLGMITHHAGELLIGYTLQGQEMRESLVSLVTRTPLAGGATAINSQITLGVRAPDGLLDFAFAERVRSSLRLEENWARQRAQWAMGKWQEARARASATIDAWHQKRMSEITLAGMTARHNIRMNTLNDIGRINNQIVANTSATNDRMHAATMDAIQEVQPWRDPSSGQQVDLSIHYNNAWQLSDGRQFLTNDSSFDPNRDLGLTGHRLEPVR